MSNQIPSIDDRRGLVFTINRDSNPVYQVESSTWAHESNRWREEDIPPVIREKVAQLEQTGKPGSFVSFLQGDTGIYVICEKNINHLPQAADTEIMADPFVRSIHGRQLSPYDIIIRAKGGAVHTQSGKPSETQEGAYYVIRCQTWGRFVVDPSKRPDFVETTKEFLLLLDNLHGHNFLSMSPHKPIEGLPSDMVEPEDAVLGITCYVLNLSSFKP